MKLLITFTLTLFVLTGSALAQCVGNPASYCTNTQVGLGCKMQFGSGSCVMKYHGGCNRFWNSSGQVVFAPARSTGEWYGFISKSPSLNIGRAGITCPF